MLILRNSKNKQHHDTEPPLYVWFAVIAFCFAVCNNPASGHVPHVISKALPKTPFLQRNCYQYRIALVIRAESGRARARDTK
jgi:hypothetical protein